MKKAAFILALAMLLGVAAGCGESNGKHPCSPSP